MNRTEYVERLMKIGILECCAERTVDAFLERDEYAALRNGGGFLLPFLSKIRNIFPKPVDILTSM